MPPVAGLAGGLRQVLAVLPIPSKYWLLRLGSQYDANQPGDCSATAWRQYQKAVLSLHDRKHQRTLELIFVRPVSGSVPWRDVLALFQELGAEISEREGSRVAVVLCDEVRVFHRPHPLPNTDKGAVASIRRWLEQHGVTP